MTQARAKGLSRSKWAYEELRAQIVNTDLMPGRSYLEQELADRLGVSRTPLREAALQLQVDGLVRIKPRSGIQVLPVSTADMAEVFQVLALLEPAAVAALARRRPQAVDIAPLIDAVTEMDQAYASNDRRRWVMADRQFHIKIAELSGNKRLSRIADTLWDQVHRARIATVHLRDDLDRSNEDHRRLVELILEGDEWGAEALLRRHRQQAARIVVPLLESAAPEGA